MSDQQLPRTPSRKQQKNPLSSSGSPPNSGALTSSSSGSSIPSNMVGTTVVPESSNPNPHQEQQQRSSLSGDLSSSSTSEVNYRSAATPLFLAIEECDWNAATSYCHNNPSHVRTWVVSTGTEHTLFNWSVWRRLPIHEACRRQPPVSMIQTLLSIYPEAVFCTSQFGELPLHLAAGCGASSEVVYMLLSFNPWGVIVRDNGGRTPLEIVRSGGKLREDSHLIEEALEQCEKAVHDKNEELEERLNKLKNEHKKEVRKMKMKSDEALQQKDDAINNLRKRLERSKAQIDELVDTMKECESRIMDKNDAETHLMDRVFHLEKENGKIRAENHKLKNMVLVNDQKLEEKQEQIEELAKVMQSLLMDVHHVVEEKDKSLQKARQHEKQVQIILENQRRATFEAEKERESLLNSAKEAAKATNRLVATMSTRNLEENFDADNVVSSTIDYDYPKSSLLEATAAAAADKSERQQTTKKEGGSSTGPSDIDNDNVCE